MASTNLQRKYFTTNACWTAPAGVFSVSVTVLPVDETSLHVRDAHAQVGIEIPRDARFGSGAWVWGENTSGMLGINSITPICTPTFLGFNWKQISFGNNSSVGIDLSGNLYAWGDSSCGRSGQGNTTPDLCVPTLIPTPFKWKRAAIGSSQVAAISDDGTLWMWGSGHCGMLGNGDICPRCFPTRICSSLKFRAVSTGCSHTLAIDTNGCGYAWGSGLNGKTGQGVEDVNCCPTVILGGQKWKAIFANTQSSYGIDSDGYLWAWGIGDCGNQGTCNSTSHCCPVRVCSDIKFKQISGGGQDTCPFVIALAEDGTGYSWGSGHCGRTGLGCTGSANYPRPICCDFKWAYIGAGLAGGQGITVDGEYYVWGAPLCGRLGNGSIPTAVCQPTKVSTQCINWKVTDNRVCGATYGYETRTFSVTPGCTYNVRTFQNLIQDVGIKSVAVGLSVLAGGSANMAAVTDDGDLYAWGVGLCNAIGDGGTTERNLPMRIGCDCKWSAVTFNCLVGHAITCTGKLFGWGFNISGAIGDNTLTNKSTPTQVGSSSQWTNVSNGIFITGACIGTLGINSGNPYSWGDALCGAGGRGTITRTCGPSAIQDSCLAVVMNGRQITGSYQSGMFVESGTNLGWAFGSNECGALGRCTITTYNCYAAPICCGIQWCRLIAGCNYSFGIDMNGMAYSWGSGTCGRTGQCSISPTCVPTVMCCCQLIWKDISAGGEHVLGITCDGNLYAWGSATCGALGNGNSVTPKCVPTRIASWTKWRCICAGYFVSAGIDCDGKLYTWGSGICGVLGLNDCAGRDVPTITPGIAKAVRCYDAYSSFGAMPNFTEMIVLEYFI